MSDIKVLHVIARMNVGGTARYVGELIKGIPGMNLATGYVQGNELEDKIMDEIKIFIHSMVTSLKILRSLPIKKYL